MSVKCVSVPVDIPTWVCACGHVFCKTCIDQVKKWYQNIIYMLMIAYYINKLWPNHLTKWFINPWRVGEEMEDELNIDKCMVLTVTLKNNQIKDHYILHNHKRTSVTSNKYLGVIYNCNWLKVVFRSLPVRRQTQYWLFSVEILDLVREKPKLTFT